MNENYFLSSFFLTTSNIFIICFEVKENFDKNSIINWLNKIESINEKQKKFKDVYLVLCKFDELVQEKRFGELKNNFELNDEILNSIDIEVKFLYEFKYINKIILF